MATRKLLLVVAGGVTILMALRAIGAVHPLGMMLFFAGLFAGLKVVAGMRTWWHAGAGAATASLIWLAWGTAEPPVANAALLRILIVMLLGIAAVALGKVLVIARSSMR